VCVFWYVCVCVCVCVCVRVCKFVYLFPFYHHLTWLAKFYYAE
jgi:hypothetical protein